MKSHLVKATTKSGWNNGCSMACGHLLNILSKTWVTERFLVPVYINMPQGHWKAWNLCLRPTKNMGYLINRYRLIFFFQCLHFCISIKFGVQCISGSLKFHNQKKKKQKKRVFQIALLFCRNLFCCIHISAVFHIFAARNFHKLNNQ